MRRIGTGERPAIPLDVLHLDSLNGVLEDVGLYPGRFGPAALNELNRAWHLLPRAGLCGFSSGSDGVRR